jgi:hypothetical protein
VDIQKHNKNNQTKMFQYLDTESKTRKKKETMAQGQRGFAGENKSLCFRPWQLEEGDRDIYAGFLPL